MTSTTRTDVHAPKNLVTEDYEYVTSYDAHPYEGDRRGIMEYIARTGHTFGENNSAGSCYHCGAHMRYVAVLLHTPTQTLIEVGEQCLANRFERATADFHQLRKAAQLNRQQMRIKTVRAAWFAVDEDREVAFNWADEQVHGDGGFGYEGMRHSFVHKINRYGSTSDKFVRAIMRDMARTERIAAERAARAAAEAATASPVIEGRHEISGEVLSVKWQENDYGSRHVMTVRDDRGFKVWGSVPNSLDPEKGDRIAFTATVEAAQARRVYDRQTGEMVEQPADESFGFFKRPSKARHLDDGEQGAPAPAADEAPEADVLAEAAEPITELADEPEPTADHRTADGHALWGDEQDEAPAEQPKPSLLEMAQRIEGTTPAKAPQATPAPPSAPSAATDAPTPTQPLTDGSGAYSDRAATLDWLAADGLLELAR